MQESPGLKPHGLTEINPLSRKKPNISLYKSLPKILLQSKLDVKTLGLFVTFNVNWHNIRFFPLAWIYTIVYVVIENEPQWFANGSITYLYHAKTDLIMTIRFTWI